MRATEKNGDLPDARKRNYNAAKSQDRPSGALPISNHVRSQLAGNLGVNDEKVNLFQLLLLKEKKKCEKTVEVVDIDTDSQSNNEVGLHPPPHSMAPTLYEALNPVSSPIPKKSRPDVCLNKTVPEFAIDDDEIQVIDATPVSYQAMASSINISPKSQIRADKVLPSTSTDMSAEIELVTLSDDQCEPDEPANINDDDVICIEDLTLLEEVNATIVQEKLSPENQVPKPQSAKSKKRKSKKANRLVTMFDGLNKEAFSRELRAVRHWESVPGKDDPIDPNVPSEDLRVCSYNILCQHTIGRTMYLYPHLRFERHLLDWPCRWEKLQIELLLMEADIYGLQEVQEDHFNKNIRPFFENIGYRGFFKQRTGGEYIDGCAIFYRASKFDYEMYKIVEYDCGVGTYLDKPQIAQILQLRSKTTRERLVIANTHLLFNKNRGDIKIGQLALLFAHIHDMISVSPIPVSIIITGDFNLEPLSHCYKYVVESKLLLKGVRIKDLSGQGSFGGAIVDANLIMPKCCRVLRDGMYVNGCGLDPRRKLVADMFSHPFTLQSVYTHGSIDRKSELREISTHHVDSGNPDFIFYSVASKVVNNNTVTVSEMTTLRLLKRYSLPALGDLEQLAKWPNAYVPSDHIPLIADFRLSSQ